ncbi:MAG: hypothetical protein ACOYO9_11190 [Candidatus Nanopelagicales bacterium]
MDPVGADTQEFPDAAAVIDAVIAPSAELVDHAGVQRSAIDALAAAGLLGSPLAPAAQRELAELLSAADASTWFCWVQHQSPLRTLAHASSPGADALRGRWLGGLESGQQLAAVAFAHLRRPGAPNPVASRTAGGWVLNGTLDWVTSWDIADVVMIMARCDGDDAAKVICCFLPAGRSGVPIAGLEVGEPLSLLAMGGTHTRPLVLRDLFVPDESVAAVDDLGGWLAVDAVRTMDASPAAFGVTRGALRELNGLAVARGDAGIERVVERLAEQCREIRRDAYSLADLPSKSQSAERLHLRAASLDLVVRATTAVVIARAGAGVLSGTSAERRVREAMFLQVQAQTADSRRAGLRWISDNLGSIEPAIRR